VSTSTQYPHLTIDEGGIVRVGNSRYKVLHLAGEHYHYGWSAEELLRQHPDLRPEEVYAALTYFYDHHDDMVRQLAESAQRAESLHGRSPLSRDDLLRRKRSAEPS
jgi:uncharacterized protein (DUF433 family)